jgi:sulfopyruvate decarboxylase subunit alpha
LAEAAAATHRPSELLAALKRVGVRVVVAVPDGWLGEFLVEVGRDSAMSLIRATHEEEALAIACGARLGGARAVLMIQNVGLLTIGAGMVCLAQRYQFPLLILASNRGTLEDPVFYHIPKGRATEPVLRGLGLGFALVRPERPIGPQVERAATYAEEASLPFVMLLSREDVHW